MVLDSLVYQSVNVGYGFQDGDRSPVIDELDLAIGQRRESSVELHVRGTARMACTNFKPFGFAGSIMLRQERSYGIEHDIKVLKPGILPDIVAMETLAFTIQLALDQHAEATLLAEIELFG